MPFTNGTICASLAQSYGPEAVAKMSSAFEEAWGEISRELVNSNPEVIADARIALAQALLAAAHDEILEVSELKKAALLGMEASRPRHQETQQENNLS